MKVTVCQLRDDPAGLEADWAALVAHVRQHESEFVLLPEMPFYPWPFWRDRFSPAVWDAAVAAHDQALFLLAELAPAVVAGSRPVDRAGDGYNEGFVWDMDGGYRPSHTKCYLPDENGFWEATWYDRGELQFTPTLISPFQAASPLLAGFLICTELWFMDRARAYGKAGVQLLLSPRATERATVEKWLVGGRAAAIIGGAFSLSSNKVNDLQEPVSLGGQGWVVDPDGNVLALTGPEQPFVTVDIDLAHAETARTTYPRYVEE